MPVVRATLWSILGAYLLLPMGTSVDLPMVPPLDKVTVPNLAAFWVCRMVLGKRVPLLPRSTKTRGLMLLYIASPFVTALLNADPVVSGPTYIDGMKSYDALSAVIRQLLFILPFLLGLQFFKSGKDLEEVLLLLAFAGLCYSLPMLLEVRVSPQLHNWIYGYFPHSFLQQMRDGGFRPVVFIGHGLWVAFFTMSAFVAAAALLRIRRPVRRFSGKAVMTYLALVLVLCKSMASLVYAAFLASWIRFFTPRQQVRLATIIVMIALTYPVTRGLGWFPVQQISEIAASMSEERAHSFDFRMRNEDMLLNKANQRPWFGWGTWGRNRIYDAETGRDISVTDGRWIQVMGQFGWVGLIAEFGLLALPVIRSAKTLRYLASWQEAIVMAAVTLMLSVSILDLLPNNTMSPWTWLMAGALLGRTQQIALERKRLIQLKDNAFSPSLQPVQ